MGLVLFVVRVDRVCLGFREVLLSQRPEAVVAFQVNLERATGVFLVTETKVRASLVKTLWRCVSGGMLVEHSSHFAHRLVAVPISNVPCKKPSQDHLGLVRRQDWSVSLSRQRHQMSFSNPLKPFSLSDPSSMKFGERDAI